MKSPLSVYQDKLQQHQTSLSQIRRKLFASSMLRLAIFLVFAFLIYFFSSNTALVLLFVFLAIASFLFLVSRHTDLQQEKEKLKQLIALNETEIKVLHRDFYDLPNGKEFVNPQHEFSQDIDLFGDRSFFQYLNRTALASGKQKLADLLSSNDITYIEEKQESIKELAEKIDFRQEFTAVAKMVKAKVRSSIILDWFSNYQAFVPSIFKWLPKIFTVVSLGLFIALSIEMIPWYYLAAWFVIGWTIIGRYAKKVNEISGYVNEIQSTFQQYHLLLGLIENNTFEAELNRK
ncbi:DNA mismatch repair protein MutS, partial [Aquimarina celericrescens]|nr:DNA mismatch repair protein MutS [Aquimarina celericrescens]